MFRESLRGLRRMLLALVMGLVLLPALALPALATGVYDVPTLQAGAPTYVLDQAEVLSRSNEGAISGELKQLSQSTGTEVRFVTIRRLDYGETIDSFTEKLFQAWYPDAETRANQVLIGLDNVTNTIAIAVGDKAAETLTPEIAESVVSETMALPLRRGNQYNRSLADASDRLVAVLSGQPDPGPPVMEEAIDVEGTFASAEETEESRGNNIVLVVVTLVLATVIPMVTYWWYVK